MDLVKFPLYEFVIRIAVGVILGEHGQGFLQSALLDQETRRLGRFGEDEDDH